MADWRKAMLRRIGAPVTAQNLRFLSGWQRWEGGHTHNSASYNWLNTTHGPGSRINSVGVKAFPDFDTGIRSLAETLQNGRYDDIVHGLMTGNPFKGNLDAGLSTWVSGSPTARLDYARKVMGGKSSPAPARGGGGPAPVRSLMASPALPKPPEPPGLPDDLLYDVWGDLAPLFKRLTAPAAPVAAPRATPAGGGGRTAGERGHRAEVVGDTLVLPTEWKSTHVTDGLSGEGFRSAIDIMGKAGTPVGAPESGQIVRWGSAQGGQSIWFKADSGRMYWIGHTDNLAKPGTRVKRGQVIARISADHPRPHVHLDRR